MKYVALISLLLFSTTAYSINELEQMTPAQSQAMSVCMEEYNDLHKCYKLSVSETSNENCTESFETGEVICQNENGTLRSKKNEGSANTLQAKKSPCSMAFYTASTKCNSQLTPSPQTNILLASIQSAKSAGNIKEACAAAQNLSALSWNMNTTFGLQCQSAVRNCLIACDADSSERDTCKTLETNVKLAQSQSIESAKSYSQSQECAHVASGCGNNSYDDPSCPQYCLKPGRQNDSLCTNQKSLAQERPLPINSKIANTPNTQNIGTGNLSAIAPEKYPEFNNSKNDFVTQDESSLESTKNVNVTTPSNGSSGSYIAGTSNLPSSTSNQEKSNENSNKTTQALNTTDNSTTGGGSFGTGFTPSYARGYPDAIEPEEDTKKWYDLTRFLPMSEEEKINRNMRLYNQKLLAQSQRPINKNSPFTNAKLTKNKNPEIAIEQARMPTSEPEKKGLLRKNKALIIINLLAVLSLIYFFFIREKT